MKFRYHKGSLEESMATVVDFNGFCELVRIIQKGNDHLEVKAEDVKVGHYCYDERVKWDTNIVTIDGYGVVGFTDGDPYESSQ